MIESWRDFRAFVAADFRSMGARLSMRTILVDPVARFVVTMRLLEYVLNSRKPSIIRIPVLVLFRRMSVRLGFSLSPNTFGPGVAIVHYGLLIIAPGTRIGANCRVHMGVQIGGLPNFAPDAPAQSEPVRIGDNVYLAPGCKIYGPVVIGDDCVIGANAVVTRSFPEPSQLLVGAPARAVEKDPDRQFVIRGHAAPSPPPAR